MQLEKGIFSHPPRKHCDHPQKFLLQNCRVVSGMVGVIKKKTLLSKAVESNPLSKCQNGPKRAKPRHKKSPEGFFDVSTTSLGSETVLDFDACRP